jgi:hypothetical protein
MTRNYEEQIAALDRKIEKLGAFVNHHINSHEQRFADDNKHLATLLKMVTDAHKRCDGLDGAIRILKRMVDTHTDEWARMRREKMRCDEAYYHIFPERLAQDVKLSDQLDALTSKASPDGEGKSS